jgi:hypothetical protein
MLTCICVGPPLTEADAMMLDLFNFGRQEAYVVSAERLQDARSDDARTTGVVEEQSERRMEWKHLCPFADAGSVPVARRAEREISIPVGETRWRLSSVPRHPLQSYSHSLPLNL